MLEAILAVASIALPALRSDVRHKQELLQARRLHAIEAEHTRDLVNEKMTHRANAFSKEGSLALRRHNLGMEVARSLSRREALRDAWQQRTGFLQTMILIVSLVFSMVFVSLTQGRISDIAQVQYTVAVESVDFANEWLKLFQIVEAPSNPSSSSSAFSVIRREQSRENYYVGKAFSQIYGAYLWMLSTGLSIGSLAVCLWLSVLIQRRIGRYRVLPSLADAGSAATSATVWDNPFQQHKTGRNKKNDDDDENDDDDDDNEEHGREMSLGNGHLAVSSTVYAATGGAVDGQGHDQDHHDEYFDDEDEYFAEDENIGDSNNNNNNVHSSVASPAAVASPRPTNLVFSPNRNSAKTQNKNRVRFRQEGGVLGSSSESRHDRSPNKKNSKTNGESSASSVSPNKNKSSKKSKNITNGKNLSEDEWELIDDEIQSVVNFIMEKNEEEVEEIPQGGNSGNNDNDIKEQKNQQTSNKDEEANDDADHDSGNSIDVAHTNITLLQAQHHLPKNGDEKIQNRDNLDRKNATSPTKKLASPTKKVRLTAKLIRQLNMTPAPLNDESGDSKGENEKNAPFGDTEFNQRGFLDNEDAEEEEEDQEEEEEEEKTEKKQRVKEEKNPSDIDESEQQDKMKIKNASKKQPPKIVVGNKDISTNKNTKSNNISAEPQGQQQPVHHASAAVPTQSSSSSSIHFLYNCGKTHKSFNSYYDCHCEPLRKIAAYLLGIGTFCALLSGASLHAMVMNDVFQHHAASSYFPVSLLIFVSIATLVWSKIGASSDKLLPDSFNHGEGDFMGLNQEVREAA